MLINLPPQVFSTASRPYLLRLCPLFLWQKLVGNRALQFISPCPKICYRLPCPHTCTALRRRNTRSYDSFCERRLSAKRTTSDSSGIKSSDLNHQRVSQWKKEGGKPQSHLSVTGGSAEPHCHGPECLAEPWALHNEACDGRDGHDGGRLFCECDWELEGRFPSLLELFLMAMILRLPFA